MIYFIKFIDICIGLYFIEVFLTKCEFEKHILKNICIIIIFSTVITLIEHIYLYGLSLLFYILFLLIINHRMHIQSLFNITFFKVVDRMIFEILMLIILYLSNFYYQDLINNIFLIILLHVLSKSIEFLLLDNYSDRFMKLQYIKQNKQYVLTVVFNICIIISFQFVDVNLISYNQKSFSTALLLYMMIIIVYIFSISYIYQIYLNHQIEDTLKLYNFQYKYLEEINVLQQKYLKENHDLKALLYKYVDYSDVKAYLKKTENFQMIKSGQHTVDIVCNYYLNKHDYKIIIDIKKEIMIDDKVLMKLLDMVLMNFFNESIEIYCDDMFVVRISGNHLYLSHEFRDFLNVYEFIFTKSNDLICIMKINHS